MIKKLVAVILLLVSLTPATVQAAGVLPTPKAHTSPTATPTSPSVEATPAPAPAPAPTTPSSTESTADDEKGFFDNVKDILSSITGLGKNISKMLTKITGLDTGLGKFFKLYDETQDVIDQFNNHVTTQSPSGIANSFTRSLSEVTEPIKDIFIALGYVIMTLGWFSALGKRTISLELFEMKGFLKEVGPLLLSLFLVGAIPKLCEFIDYVVDLINEPLNASGINQAMSIPPLWRLFLGALIPIILVLVITFKLMVRRFMLMFYQIVSPIFGGFASSPGGRKYLTNFLIHYSLLSFSVVIMNVALTLYYGVLNLASSAAAKALYGVLYGIVTIGIVVTADKKFEKIFR